MDDDLFAPDDGIEAPNYTQFPNVLLDWLMPRTSGAEFKVMAYLVRCTWGYHVYDEPVPISLTAICEGTGVSRKAVIAALRDYEARGFVVAEKRQSTEHGHEASTYRLRVRKSLHASGVSPLGGRVSRQAPSSVSPLASFNERKTRKESRATRDDKDRAHDPDDYTGGKYGHRVEP